MRYYDSKINYSNISHSGVTVPFYVNLYTQTAIDTGSITIKDFVTVKISKFSNNLFVFVIEKSTEYVQKQNDELHGEQEKRNI